ncbi:MAG: LysR substrate-binding domain-containing protein [Neisseria sp.]|nr:LysR substrate-binding domain-containing protein [Neisseria sp.]
MPYYISFMSAHGQDVQAMLDKGECDVAMLGEQSVPPRMHARRLYRQNYVCAVRPNHPVLQQAWNLDAFCALDFVLLSFKGGGFTGTTDETLAKLGRSRRVVMSLTDALL